MKFEYNGHLTFEERVEEVSKDIISKYKEIDIETAKKAAALESPITTNVNDEIVIRRLYNLALLNKDNEVIKNKIVYDMLDYYKDKIGENEKIDELLKALTENIFYGAEFPNFN